MVVEQDALAGDLKNCQVLYLTDRHVSHAASKTIADWVGSGGRLLATAGAGMFDELNRPNEAMRALLGVDEQSLEISPDPIRFEKQDLPFAKPICTLFGRETTPVFGAKSTFTIREKGGASPELLYSDKAPAFTVRRLGNGRAAYCGFLPGLAYFKPGIPMRPVDRGTGDDSMAHFMPVEFEPISLSAVDPIELHRPVTCSERLVEIMIIESKHGTLITLVNWSGRPVRDLDVTVHFTLPGEPKLASGNGIRKVRGAYRLNLDVADAIIFRR